MAQPSERLLLGLAIATLAVAGAAPSQQAAGAQVRAPALQPAWASGADPHLQAFYAARGWRPLWVRGGRLRPEARQVALMISRAADDGLDPTRFDAPRLLEVTQSGQRLTRDELDEAELRLSRAWADYLVALRTPASGAGLTITDPATPIPQRDRVRILEAAASTPSLAAHLEAARRMNPIYEGLRTAYGQARARGAAEAELAAIRLNLDRARAIPANPGPRWALVDVAAQELRWYENGRLAGAMPVAVGKPSMATPAMAGMIRYAVHNPYWNIPPDLARATWAPRVLRGGPDALTSAGIEPLSDWTPHATPVEASRIDWNAVAAGRTLVRLRQSPGPHNMMGEMKFMLPNRLGIYLHDTPDKAVFARSRRLVSSGCVRLADAPRFARWLLGPGGDLAPSAAPEHRVDLPRPVPVYIAYFTAVAGPEGLERRADIYGRDKPGRASA